MMGRVHETNAEFCRLLTNSGWHQARAARALRLTTGTVSRYVSGEIRPSLTVLRLFSQLLGERLLIPGEQDPDPHALRDGPRWMEEWEVDALAVFRRLSPEARRDAVRAFRALADALASRHMGAPLPDPIDSALSGLRSPEPHAGDDAPPPAPRPVSYRAQPSPERSASAPHGRRGDRRKQRGGRTGDVA